MVTNDENFQCMEEDAYEVVTQYVKAEELVRVKDEYRKDGKIDMCQALKELIEEGREEGRDLAIRDVVVRIVKKGISDEEIMELTECSATLIREVRESMTCFR